MRTYFQTDTIFAPALSLLESFEYPFTTADVRPSIPIFITDQILCRETTKSSATVKFITTSKYFCDFLQNFFIYIFFFTGKQRTNCRVCHPVGDVLCCETCPAVYLLECVDPPFGYVPEEDCPVCTAEFCEGVTDAKADLNNHVDKYICITRLVFVKLF